MGRNNADFHSITGMIHFSHKRNRANIERHGLRAVNPTGADPIDGVDLGGVYAYHDAATAHQEEAETGGSARNQDIWAINSDSRRAWMDDPHMWGVASYTPHDVYPYELKRVGHTTENNEVHWHPEEHCNG